MTLKNLAIIALTLLLSVCATQAANYTVINTNDSGAGSLRQAILDANANPGSDTISFNLSDCPCTITLTSGELFITDSVIVNGLGANQLSISGNNSSRVFNINSGEIILNGLTITRGKSNSANGGGVLIETGAVVTVRNSKVSQNTISSDNQPAVGGSGGGIYNLGRLAVANSTISSNSAGFGTSFFGSGGGVLNEGKMTLTRSTVSNNSVGLSPGAGIDNRGVLIVVNSTISNNSSGIGGSGIHSDSGSFLTIINSTLTGNRMTDAGFGGGVFIGGKATLNNTIVAGNFKDTAPSDIYGTVETANHNLIGDAATSGGIVHGVNGNIVGNAGVGTIDINTVLNTTLADNGGPTMTHALVLSFSNPAINAGSNVLALDANAKPLTTDQRGAGFPRIVGGRVDIGAFELQQGLFVLPEEIIENLIEIIRNSNPRLPNGIEKSLLAKLENAMADLAKGATQGAEGKIKAFINHVQAQSGKAISPEIAEILIGLSNEILIGLSNESQTTINSQK